VSGLADSELLHRDRLWPAVLASVAVHAALGSLAIVARPGPTLDLGQRPIVAKLVRLGEPRPKELLPRKEEPPPGDPGPPAPAAPEAPAPPTPRAAPAAKATPRATAKPADHGGTRPAGSRLASVLHDVKRELAAGRADGDPSGDASEGSEGDQYLGLVVQALRQSYRLPTTLSERERLFLQGTLLLFVEPDGRISRFEFLKRSGNSTFDEALERAVRQTRVPPPPAAARDLYRRTGLEVLFKIS
jgi:colicin import membrane protein